MKISTKAKAGISITALSAIAWLGFIFSNSLKTGMQSADQSEAAENFLIRILRYLDMTKRTEDYASVIVRKAAHIFEFFVLFLLLVLALYLIWRSIKLATALSATAAFLCGCTDEYLQTFSNRGASAKDVLIDSLGIVLGLVLVWLAWLLKQYIFGKE